MENGCKTTNQVNKAELMCCFGFFFTAIYTFTAPDKKKSALIIYIIKKNTCFLFSKQRPQVCHTSILILFNDNEHILVNI